MTAALVAVLAVSSAHAQPPVARPQPPPPAPNAKAPVKPGTTTAPTPATPQQPVAKPQSTPPAAPPQPQPAARPPATLAAAVPASRVPAIDAEAPPAADQLNAPVLAGAQFLASYDAGMGQKFYLYGSTQAFADVVTYYRTVLKDRGELVFDAARHAHVRRRQVQGDRRGVPARRDGEGLHLGRVARVHEPEGPAPRPRTSLP